MGDQPATKKELAALQKQVDELRKWFQDEKKAVHAELDGLTPKKWFDDEKKVVHDELDNLSKYADELGKYTEDLSKSTDGTFAERKQWFDDEKKWTHGELENLRKWVQDELNKLKK